MAFADTLHVLSTQHPTVGQKHIVADTLLILGTSLLEQLDLVHEDEHHADDGEACDTARSCALRTELAALGLRKAWYLAAAIFYYAYAAAFIVAAGELTAFRRVGNRRYEP